MTYISKEKPCGRCKWNNDCGDSERPIIEGRMSHCEDGTADQYDEYPNATVDCSGYEIIKKCEICNQNILDVQGKVHLFDDDEGIAVCERVECEEKAFRLLIQQNQTTK